MHRTRLLAAAVLGVAVAVIAGCGGSSGVTAPTIAAARVFSLDGFEPAGPVAAGKPVRVSFSIRQPSGQRLTAYRRGAGPHTGIHLIVVHDDLSVLIHHHPKVAADGRLTDTIVFPKPGRYRMVVDAYPVAGPGGQSNFQLFRQLNVKGPVKKVPLPPFERSIDTDGYRLTMTGRPRLHALQPAFLTLTVKDAHGRPARFTPWLGALAHAIFFQQGSLDYFHTHVCAAGASGCASFLGSAKVAGSSSTPGKLRVGVLLPVPGTWRLFLQTRVGGRVLTAPFTLKVA